MKWKQTTLQSTAKKYEIKAPKPNYCFLTEKKKKVTGGYNAQKMIEKNETKKRESRSVSRAPETISISKKSQSGSLGRRLARLLGGDSIKSCQSQEMKRAAAGREKEKREREREKLVSLPIPGTFVCRGFSGPMDRLKGGRGQGRGRAREVHGDAGSK